MASLLDWYASRSIIISTFLCFCNRVSITLNTGSHAELAPLDLRVLWLSTTHDPARVLISAKVSHARGLYRSLPIWYPDTAVLVMRYEVLDYSPLFSALLLRIKPSTIIYSQFEKESRLEAPNNLIMKGEQPKLEHSKGKQSPKKVR